MNVQRRWDMTFTRQAEADSLTEIESLKNPT
jgi:hypothetical protein